jgi:hypothetical protein
MPSGNSLSQLEAENAALAERVRELELRAQNDELMKRLAALESGSTTMHGSIDGASEPRLALGTGDQSRPAGVAVARLKSNTAKRSVQAPQPLSRRLLDACRISARTAPDLVRSLDVKPEQLQQAIAEVTAAGELVNIGMEARPRYFTKIGDETSTDVLIATVRYLIGEAPRTIQDLMDLTGARQPRVNGARQQLIRNGERLINLGSAKNARWLLVPKGVRLEK